MIEWVTLICGMALALAILTGLYRMAVGPTVLDRILAFDMVTICAVALMGMLSIRWHTTLFLELILVFSLLGFFGTVALVFYLEKSLPPYPPDLCADEQEGGHHGMD
ncbi:MAG: monovalent cation/H+ antiporter complex subunit F [Candidatus Methylacidiphilales bacterium]